MEVNRKSKITAKISFCDVAVACWYLLDFFAVERGDGNETGGKYCISTIEESIRHIFPGHYYDGSVSFAKRPAATRNRSMICQCQCSF